MASSWPWAPAAPRSAIGGRLAMGGGWPREAGREPATFVAKGASGRPFDDCRAGFDARWELDRRGRARRLREGAGAAARASAYEREALRVALAGETAAGYFRLRGAQAALATARELHDAEIGRAHV